MEIIKLKDDYIKLGQALKAAGLVESGVEAKYAVLDGLVKVNGRTQLQRGKKLYEGDIVEFQGNQDYRLMCRSRDFAYRKGVRLKISDDH